ncbi:MAG: cob(I)yrinic acid a,c-diamide adenosyltransferase [Thermodesulfobacteriota bacterium]
MRIYTGTGDRGRTSLFSGERVSKRDPRVWAYGELDELNSVLGLLETHLPVSEEGPHREIHRIQSILFQAGAWIAVTPGGEAAALPGSFQAAHGVWLESAIDRMDAFLPELTAFILPGGGRAASMAHLARTVCRRVERRLVGIVEETSGEPHESELHRILVFLNRLSDYLFVLARYCNLGEGIPETVWRP